MKNTLKLANLTSEEIRDRVKDIKKSRRIGRLSMLGSALAQVPATMADDGSVGRLAGNLATVLGTSGAVYQKYKSNKKLQQLAKDYYGENYESDYIKKKRGGAKASKSPIGSAHPYTLSLGRGLKHFKGLADLQDDVRSMPKSAEDEKSVNKRMDLDEVRRAAYNINKSKRRAAMGLAFAAAPQLLKGPNQKGFLGTKVGKNALNALSALSLAGTVHQGLKSRRQLKNLAKKYYDGDHQKQYYDNVGEGFHGEKE